MVELLLAHGANVNPMPDWLAPLQGAIMNNHQHLADLLLERGADMNAPATPKDDRTALQAAAGKGHLELASRLVMGSGDIHSEAA